MNTCYCAHMTVSILHCGELTPGEGKNAIGLAPAEGPEARNRFTPPGTHKDRLQDVATRSSRRTLRWREMDSNHRYRIRNNPFWLPPFGPAIRLP